MIKRMFPQASSLPPVVDLNTARYAILKGETEVHASAPGMMTSAQAQSTCISFIRYPLYRAGILVSIRWLWCREFEDGRAETVWKVTRK